MTEQVFRHNGIDMPYQQFGKGRTHIIWAHGWGHTGQNLLPLAKKLAKQANHYVVDFPGFGKASLPPAAWGVEDYADYMSHFLKTLPEGKRIWVGHSFGCRVAIRLAAKNPKLLDGMVLIAAAGLKYRHNIFKKAYIKGRVYTYKALKKLAKWGVVSTEWLQKTFGSADYKNAQGPMRSVFVKVVNDDLAMVAPKVTCPVMLLFAEADTATPPDFAYRYARLMPRARAIVLGGLDHWTILTKGEHQVTHRIQRFITDMDKELSS